jgi:RND superfamily putative drug exporter
MAILLYRLGHLAVRRRRAVLVAWVVVLAATLGASAAIGSTTDERFVLPGTESQDAADLLQERFPQAGWSSSQIVFASAHDEGTTDRAGRTRIERVLDDVAAIDGVAAVVPPQRPAGVSADGRVALAQVYYPVSGFEVDEATVAAVADTIEAARDDEFAIEIGGEVVPNRRPEQQSSEAIGLAIAVAVLLVSFGSVVAMGLPVVTALLGLGVTLSALAVLSALVDLSQYGPTLAMMIGLAVGIDYALFIVTRHRENLTLGLAVPEAAARANATAGAAVVFAGTTVIIALAGLMVVGIPYVSGLGLSCAVAVLVAVLVAVSLLPALLGFVGTRIDRFRVPGTRSRTDGAHEGATIGVRWARGVTARPRLALIGAAGLMIVLAIPVTGIRLGFPDGGDEPTTTSTRRAYDIVASAFGPGANGPLVVVADVGGVADADRAAERIRARLAAADGVAVVQPPVFNEERDTAVITVVPTTGPADEATEALVRHLRGDERRTLEEGGGVRYFVAGSTASLIDISSKMTDALPSFMMFVIGLTFLLLTVVFRSLLVPIKAALAILLSIAAAFGIVVAVFQWGWLAELIGVHQRLPIVSFTPMMMFAILFGLSMDYEVFILARIREEYARSGDARASVLVGISASARVITAAALIMVSVFAAFILGDHVMIKIFGLGLSAAVLLDATLVRMVIVPAAMTLFGERAWRLPGWLDRVLPDLDVEGRGLAEWLDRRDAPHGGQPVEPPSTAGAAIPVYPAEV